MWPILQSLVENCSLAIAYTDRGLHFAAQGPVGVIALVLICGLLALHLRRRRGGGGMRDRLRRLRSRTFQRRFKRWNEAASKVPSASLTENPFPRRVQYAVA